jgi:mRNA (guanine-N7-)-methyltransferase
MSVIDQYNKRLDKNDRGNSNILHIRKANNFIKMCLIAYVENKNKTVLDYACGQGGDITKWGRSRVSNYIGIDLAGDAIKRAIDRCIGVRYKKWYNLKTSFMEYDLREKIPELDNKVDIISMMYCLHYIISTTDKLTQLINDINRTILPNGYVIGVIPSSEKIRGTDWETSSNKWMSVKRDADDGYTFSLDGVLQESKEYIIDKDMFIQTFEKNGFKMIKYENAYSFMMNEVRCNSYLYKNMRCIDVHQYTEDDKDVIGFYDIFMFQKTH